ELLPRLAAEPGVVQSVLTGNTRSNAALKLSVFGLDQWLDVDAGAFGSDHADRRELVPIAMARAADRHGRRFQPGEVWVVGDTAHDLACARAAGSHCALVATGHSCRDELDGIGADAV